MGPRGLGRRDVYHALLEQIRSGRYTSGDQLASCRDLAAEIGSNPNTVHRALKDLESEGMVRMVPRRGTFVTGVSPPAADGDWLTEELARLIERATTAGISPRQFLQRTETIIGALRSSPTLLFPECNLQDATEMARMIARATGLEPTPVLIDELEATVRELSAPPVIAVPLFHLHDVRQLELGGAPVIELDFIPDPQSLLAIASLDPTVPVTVASRYARGVDRLASVVRQYFGGVVVERLLGPDDTDLSDAEVVVHNNASGLRPVELASIRHEIKITVILEGRSAASLSDRVERAQRSGALLITQPELGQDEEHAQPVA